MEVRIRDLKPTNPDVELGHGEGVILEALAFRVKNKNSVAETSAEEQG
jgi:hypothetical protein